MGRDEPYIAQIGYGERFQPTRPYGARPSKVTEHMGRSAFQPTRPYGARHPARLPMRVLQPRVSTHAPLWGATALRLPVVGQLVVSTHAPLWGATCGRSSASLGRAKFQPTRPYGARPSSSQTRSRCALFQPTRPYGARPMCGIPNLLAVSFQPTRPYGARLRQLANPDKLVVVSTHAPLWGATSRRAGWLDGSAWFQPTRPYGARLASPL